MSESTNMLTGVSVPGNSQGQLALPTNRLRDIQGEQAGESQLFQVNSTYLVLSAYNLSSGTAELYMRDVISGMDSPVIENGTQVALSPTNTRLILDVPGFYVLYYNGIEDYSCVITMHETAMPPLCKPSSGGGAGATGATGADGATGATGATGPAGLSAAFDAYLPITFAYTNGNAVIEYDTPKHINDNDAFTWDNQTFTPVDGVFKFEAGLRVTGLVGGSFARLRIMSGLNTVAEDRYDWTQTCPVAAVTMIVTAVTSSTDTTNKALHVLIETDADTSGAMFWPSMSYAMAFRISDPPAAQVGSNTQVGA